ncbi:MAG: hypothetical protein AAB353_04425 [Candidatus Hydrogenedentota bacterium]
MRRNDSGAALFLVLFLIAALAGISSAFIVRVQQTNRTSGGVENEVIARYAAESGVEKAKALILARSASKDHEERTAIGDGEFTLTIRPESSSRYAVTSTGVYADGPVVFARVVYESVITLRNGGISTESIRRVRNGDAHGE